MPTSPAEFDKLLSEEEDEHIEFKEAKHNFGFEKLLEYCVALANERGGRLILGVTDKPPRKVVGTSTFSSPAKTKHKLYQQLSCRVEVEVLNHPNGRVVIFHVPSRPTGKPLHHQGRFLMRSGGSVVAMTDDAIRRIHDETRPDFTAETCDDAELGDLDEKAIERFRAMWNQKSGNKRLQGLGAEHLLKDAELIHGKRVTYAALILLGTADALSRLLPDAEIVFEYRSSRASVRSSDKKVYRRGFALFADDLWRRVNLRNDVQHFQDGLFVRDIPTFNEAVVREGILNAVAHRDYRRHDSIFVRQFPLQLRITSPGGFPKGVTPENILWKHSWRNRRLAEALSKCGLVERSGQGADMMFEQCIKESKPTPDYSQSDDYQVVLDLQGQVQDTRFLRFLEKVGAERSVSFTTEDLLVLDAVNRQNPVRTELRNSVNHLVDEGILERAGRKKLVLSQRFYAFLGRRGEHTRRRGLERETQKTLLLKCIQDNQAEGVRFAELSQVLPDRSRAQIKRLLAELREQGEVHCEGRTRAARWFPNIKRTD